MKNIQQLQMTLLLKNAVGLPPDPPGRVMNTVMWFKATQTKLSRPRKWLEDREIIASVGL